MPLHYSLFGCQTYIVRGGLYSYLRFDIKPHIGTKSYILKQNIKHVLISEYDLCVNISWDCNKSWSVQIVWSYPIYASIHLSRIVRLYWECTSAWIQNSMAASSAGCLIMCYTSVWMSTQHSITLICISAYAPAYLASLWGLRAAGSFAELYLLPLACKSCINRKHGRKINSIPETPALHLSCIVFIQSLIRFQGHWGHSWPFNKSTDMTCKFIYGSRLLTAHTVGRSS